MMKNNFSIRRAVEADLNAILALFETTIRQVCCKDYRPEQINAWVDSINNKEGWLDKINSQYFILVEDERKLVGFGSMEKNGYLDFLYVHHEYQGNGVASLILDELTKYVSKFNPAKIYSNVSITAKPFFENKGFKVIQSQTVERGGVELVNFRMEREF